MPPTPTRPTLYHFIDCPFSMRARVTLAELGVDYRSVVLDPDTDAEDYPEAMRRHSPDGQVPLLVHEDAGITESDRICVYLDEMFGGELMPSDGWAAARVREAFDFGEDALGAPLHELQDADLDDAAVEDRRAAIRDALLTIERWIHEDGLTLTGRFSLGDIALVPFLFDVARLEPALRGIPGVVARYAVANIGRDTVRTDPRVATSEAVIEADDGVLRPAVAQILGEKTKARQPTFFIHRGRVYEGVVQTGPSLLSFNDGQIFEGETAFGEPLATVGDDGELRPGRTATFGDLIAVVEPGAIYAPDRRDRAIAHVPGGDLMETAAAAYVYLGLQPQLSW